MENQVKRSLIIAAACLLPGFVQPVQALSAKPIAAHTSYTGRNVEIAGGFVSGLITRPAKQGLMYARTDVGGAYRWNPTTKRWIPITAWVGQADWNFTGIESIALDPTDANRVYLAAGTYTNDWAGNGAIFRSHDQG